MPLNTTPRVVVIDGEEHHLVSLYDLRWSASRTILQHAWRRSASRLAGKTEVLDPWYWHEDIPMLHRAGYTLAIEPDETFPAEIVDLLGVATLRELAPQPCVFSEEISACDTCGEAFRTTGRVTCDPCIEDAHEDAIIEETGEWFDVLPLLDYEDSLDEDVLCFDEEWYASEEDIAIPVVQVGAR